MTLTMEVDHKKIEVSLQNWTNWVQMWLSVKTYVTLSRS